MNRYETVFIVTPVLSDAQMKEAVENFRKFLKDSGAIMVNDEDWGLRKLAYPIQHKSTGFYHMFEYEAEGDVINKLEIQIRRDERIIRFLTMKMDKYAIAYSEKKSKLKKQDKKEDK